MTPEARRNRRLPAILLFAGVLLQPSRSPAESPEESGWGPAFGSRSLYALHVAVLDFGPAETRALAAGESEWNLESGYANTFSHSWHPILYHDTLGPPGTPFRADEAARIHRDFPEETAWFVDAEVLRSALSGRVGLGSSLSLAVEVPWVSHHAFSADGAIAAFHRAFGLGQAGRTDLPRGRFVVMLQASQGALRFDDTMPETGIGDVSASLSWRPEPMSGGRTFGIDVAVKAPTGAAADYNGSGSWDAGVLAFLARTGRLWRFDAQAGIVVPGRWRGRLPLSLAPFGRVFLSAARRFGPRTRIGASVTYEQSPLRREALGPVSEAGMEVALGLERDLARGVAVRLTVTEHLAALGDRADVGAALGLRWRFRAREARGAPSR
jgi:hypothetical protein